MPNALDTDTPEPEHAFYACEHGKSNSPCYCHLATDRDARPVPDDWFEEYQSPAAPGLTDSVSAGAAEDPSGDAPAP